MVKIAVAGGSGRVAKDIIQVLAASKRHEILILSRSDPSATAESNPNVFWAKIHYGDKNALVIILSGVHTVLSFVATHADPGSMTQKALIDAAVVAGVKRFAPSEWATSNFEELPWYAEKANVRAYLEGINRKNKVLEYCLFQPGGVVEQFASEHGELPIDFPTRRAITLDGHDSVFTLTTYNDLANVVLQAVEYEGEWPVVGGIQGTTIPTSKLLEIGARVRGKPFDIQKEEDLRVGNIKSLWIPRMEIPGLSEEQIDHFSKMVLTGWLLSGLHSSWKVSDEWNRLLPDCKFTDTEDFLAKRWAGKP